MLHVGLAEALSDAATRPRTTVHCPQNC